MAFDVARETGVPENEVLRELPARLLQRYEWVQQARWTRTVEQVSAVETGTMRALAVALGGKKKLPALPDYDEVIARNQAETKQQQPDWWSDYAAANPGVNL